MRKTELIVLSMILAIALSFSTGLQSEAGTTDLHSWDTKINDAGKRFVVLADFDNTAILDKETGLVWEQSPRTTTLSWEGAQGTCTTLLNGNRSGWHLPTIQELTSLLDPTQNHPALPSGHPFSDVQSSAYWAATTSAHDTSSAWIVDFSDGATGYISKSTFVHVWCVRGGQGVDPQ
jgi:hypothetical protein